MNYIYNSLMESLFTYIGSTDGSSPLVHGLTNKNGYRPFDFTRIVTDADRREVVVITEKSRTFKVKRPPSYVNQTK